MLKSLGTEIHKNLHFPFVLVSIIAFMVLFYASDGAVGNDGKIYSVFKVTILSSYLPLMKNPLYSWNSMWESGMGNWVMLIAPVIVSMGYVYVNTEEKQSKCSRFLKIREGNLRYSFSKTVGAMLSSGLIITFAYAVYGISLLFFFSPISKYDEQFRTMMEYSYGSSMPEYVFFRLLGVFLFGIFVSLIPIVLSAFTSDRYLIISLPFLSMYIYERVFTKLFFVIKKPEINDLLNALNFTLLPYLRHSSKKTVAFISLILSCLVSALIYHFAGKSEERL